MINIKELTQHVTTGDRTRFQKDRKQRASDYIHITIGGLTVVVNGPILSRIAKKAPMVEAEVIALEPQVTRHYNYPNGPFKPGVFSHETVIQRYALRLTQGATVWTLYDYTGAQ